MPQSPAGAVGPTVTVRPNVSRTSSRVIRTSVPTGGLERDEQPVGAVDEAEAGQQQAAEVLGLRLDGAEVDAPVLELPQPRGRHAGIGDGARHDGHRAERAAAGRRGRRRAGGVERVPVEPPVGVLGGLERDAVGGARAERVLQAVGHPGGGRARAGEDERVRPRHPRLRRRDHGGGVGRGDGRRGGQRRRRRAQRRLEVAVELLAVDGAPRHHGQEAPAGRIPRVGRRGDRIRGAEPARVLAEVARGEQALEVLSRADAHARRGRGVDVVGLDQRLQRHRRRRVVAEPRRGDGPPGPQLVQRRHRRRDLREDRAAAVAGRELAELPLAPEQPQRVVDARLQARRELAVARDGLQPCPACRLAGHQPEAGAATRPRSVVTVSDAGAEAR